MAILDSQGFFTLDVFGKWRRSITADEVRERVDQCNRESEALVEGVWGMISPAMRNFRLKYSISAPRDILTPYERAQSLCFIAKYDALPDSEPLNVELIDGVFIPKNLSSFRHVLNEYRPILQNQKDSSQFAHIHNLCRSKLINRDPSVDLAVTAYDAETDLDITDAFLLNLDQRNKAISALIKKSEFGYLYNGILQHSDHKFTKRYIEGYSSGRLHYLIFWHATICHTVRDLLYMHYVILHYISSIRAGGL